MLSHLDGRGHRSSLAQCHLCQRPLPVVADADVQIERGPTGDHAVLRDCLESQDYVLRGRQGGKGETQRQEKTEREREMVRVIE